MKMKAKVAALTLAGLAVATALTSCASGGDSGTINLSVQTFGQFGYDKLWALYEQQHPRVKIQATTLARSQDALNSINTHLAAGNGMPDVVAVEGGALAAVMQYPEKWLPVDDSLKSRWLPWKIAPATDSKGKVRFYGVDAGPSAICYRQDLVAAAGFPSDPAGFANWIGTTWESYTAAGMQYATKTGHAWFDTANSVLGGKLAQVKNAFEADDNSVIATTNPQVKDAFVSALTDNKQLSAKLSAQFSPDWNQGVVNGTFATALCPSWEIGLLQAAAPNLKGWNVADAFPGGGANAGGSFLGVSTQTKHADEAKALAAWLTAPEQEIAAFQAVGSFPSQVDALGSPTLLNFKSSWASDAPVGQIYAGRAKAITGAPHKGPQYSKIGDYLSAAITRVEAGTSDANSSWSQFVSDIKSNTK